MQTRKELQRILVDAGGGAPTVAVVPQVLTREEQATVVRDSLIDTEKTFKALEDDVPAPSTSPEERKMLKAPESPTSVEIEQTTGAVLLPGLERLPAPGEVTTSTLVDMIGGAGPDTIGGGGDIDSCVPLKSEVIPPPLFDPLPGLGDDIALVPPAIVTRPGGHIEKVYGVTGGATLSPSTGNWHSPVVLPPIGPECRTVPLAPVAPAIGHALQLERSPNENRQLVPPETSNIPFNPDWFYSRVDVTKLRQLVSAYMSADFLLRYDDFGYVYVEDKAEIPAAVDRVPAGAFSRPILLGTSAVAYYVEDARRLQKPPFDEIKTHAYATYRQVQVDKALQRSFDAEVASAGIRYSFESK